MSYDMQTQATEQRNMSTQTDAPPQSQSNTLSTPRSFSQNALRSGNLDAGKFIVLQLTTSTSTSTNVVRLRP